MGGRVGEPGVGSVRLSRRLRTTDVVTDLLRLVALGSLVVGILLYPVNAVVAFAVVLVIMLVPRVAELPRPVDLAVCITWLVAGWAKVAGWYGAGELARLRRPRRHHGASAAALYLLLVRIGLVPPLQDPAIRRAGIVLLTT